MDSHCLASAVAAAACTSSINRTLRGGGRHDVVDVAQLRLLEHHAVANGGAAYRQ